MCSLSRAWLITITAVLSCIVLITMFTLQQLLVPINNMLVSRYAVVGPAILEECNFTVKLNPYTKTGLSLQHFRPNVPVWEQSCLPLKFSNEPLPLTALASHPGSGTDWTRYFIQQLTGVFVGSVYNDLRYYKYLDRNFKKSNSLELWNGSVVAFKTHEGWRGSPPYSPDRYRRAIVVIRNPHDSLKAEFKRENKKKYRNNTVYHINNTKAFQEYFNKQSKSWYEFYLKWLTIDKCILVVQYERLKSDLRGQLLRIAAFLGIDVNKLKSSHIDCIVREAGIGLKRAQVNFHPYTKIMNNTLAVYKRRVRYMLRHMHHVTDIGF